MNLPEGLRFTKEHEWAQADGAKVRVGVTDYAQTELGDVVFVDLPEVGKSLAKGDSCATVESVKAVSDIYAPVSGTVVEVNSLLGDNPEKINEEPYENGWIVVIEAENEAHVEELLDSGAYQELVAEVSK